MIYKGDVGTVIKLDTLSDISSNTGLSIKVKKPSGVIQTWVSTLEGSTIVRHVIQSGELDEVGIYKLQAQVQLPGFSGSSDITSIQVDNTLS
jgi:hypothetical protein